MLKYGYFGISNYGYIICYAFLHFGYLEIILCVYWVLFKRILVYSEPDKY